tara:strand:+ start:32 stop:580 length:549 start_codon:yes stop_codon:yes gene_type:complete
MSDKLLEMTEHNPEDLSGVKLDLEDPKTSRDFLVKMEKRLDNNFKMHVSSTSYYKKMHILITIPSIVITAFSSIAAFLSTSSLVSPELQSGFSLSVGIITAVATMLQTFSSAFKYPARIESHSVAAQQYANLKTKVQFEEEIPDENFHEFTSNLEKNIIEIQNKCNFFIPEFIRDKTEKDNN